MNNFTVEEISLLEIFDFTDRDSLRNELVSAIHNVNGNTEPDLIILFGTTLEKLDSLTDEEFTALAVYLNIEGDVFEQ